MPGIMRYSSAVLVASKFLICSVSIELIDVDVFNLDLTPLDAVTTTVSSVSPGASLAAAAAGAAPASVCEYAGMAPAAIEAVARMNWMLKRNLT